MMCLERNTLSQPSPADTAQEAWAVWAPKLTSQCGAPWVHSRTAALFWALCAGTQVRKGLQGTPLWHLPVKSSSHSCGGSHCQGLSGALQIHGRALEPVTVTISGIRVKDLAIRPRWVAPLSPRSNDKHSSGSEEEMQAQGGGHVKTGGGEERLERHGQKPRVCGAARS